MYGFTIPVNLVSPDSVNPGGRGSIIVPDAIFYNKKLG